MPGFPVLHHFLDFPQTLVHLILCCPLLLLPSIFPSIRVFSNDAALLIRWPKDWIFIFSISPSMNIQDWFPLDGLVGSPCSPRDSQESSLAPMFKSINSLALSLLYFIFLSLVAKMVKNPPKMQETHIQFLDWEDSLEKHVTTHFSILA